MICLNAIMKEPLPMVHALPIWILFLAAFIPFILFMRQKEKSVTTSDGQGLNWKWLAGLAGGIIVLLLVYMIIPLLKNDRQSVILEAKQESLKEFATKMDTFLANQEQIKSSVAVVAANQNRVLPTLDKLCESVPRIEERVKTMEEKLRNHSFKTENK